MPRRLTLFAIFSIFTLSLLSRPASAFNEELDQGWSDSGTDFSLILAHINWLYPCLESEKSYLGCVQLVNAAGSLSSPEQALLPKNPEAFAPGIKYTVVRDFGAFTLSRIEDRGNKTSDPRVLSQRRLIRETAMRQAVAAQMKMEIGPHFESITRTLLGQGKNNVSEAFIIGKAVNALISVHDGHGRLAVRAYEYARQTNADRKYDGIGAALAKSQDDGRILVNMVFKGTPAEKAGLKANDVIVSINGEEVTGMDLLDVVSRIRDPKVRQVVVAAEREGKPLPDLSITRATVLVRNFDPYDVRDMGVKFRVFKLGNFSDQSACEKMREEIRRIEPDVRGIIIDVRDNQGGLRNQAICIAGLFLGDVPIVKERAVLDGVTARNSEVTYTGGAQKATDLPVTMLINDASASASEILAGAIQDYKRGFLVGTRTFGKATVQSGRLMPGFPRLMRFETTQRFYQPSNRTNQIVGIQPDFTVYRTPNPSESEKFGLHEADLVPFALPHEGPDWKQTRQDEIDTLESGCLLKRHRAEAVHALDPKAADYQLLKAQEIMTCQL